LDRATGVPQLFRTPSAAKVHSSAAPLARGNALVHGPALFLGGRGLRVGSGESREQRNGRGDRDAPDHFRSSPLFRSMNRPVPVCCL